MGSSEKEDLSRLETNFSRNRNSRGLYSKMSFILLGVSLNIIIINYIYNLQQEKYLNNSEIDGYALVSALRKVDAGMGPSLRIKNTDKDIFLMCLINPP